MQLVVVILVATVLLEARAPSDMPVRPWWALAAAVLPAALAVAWQAILVRRALRALDAGQGRGLRLADRAERAMRHVGWWAVAGLAGATVGCRWLAAVRSVIGDWPAIDEAIALLPGFLAMTASWWVHEPLERRIRDAALVRRLDEGMPIPPAPTRLAFTLSRVRTNLLLLIAPLLTVLAIGESLAPLVRRWVGEQAALSANEATTLVAAALVYVVSPWIARLVLALRPLPPGELRSDLLEVCRLAGVKVREILYWDTHHAMVNGAVMGVVAPVRYVMLTDALLELLPRDELRAVMAHEIGHVRRHHLPWMVLTLLALLSVASLVVGWPLEALYRWLARNGTSEANLRAIVPWLDYGSAVAAGLLALLAFGWVSRRFERQADTFAVQHLSESAGSPDVTPGAVAAMAGALGSVARFAGVDPQRPSWRHGSIRWRQDYLVTLAGRSVEGLPIDRQIRRLKWLALAGVGLLVWQISADLLAPYDVPDAGPTIGAAHARATNSEPPCAS